MGSMREVIKLKKSDILAELSYELIPSVEEVEMFIRNPKDQVMLNAPRGLSRSFARAYEPFMVREFDEFTEDAPGNRLIKRAITHLLRQGGFAAVRNHNLKFLRWSLARAADVRCRKIPAQRVGGNEISVKTLDLSQLFNRMQEQLEDLAEALKGLDKAVAL
ncbi:MAG: McrC family protein [Clostridiales bacterium]|nr:McrC family protein [Clostridiales bacterium]